MYTEWYLIVGWLVAFSIDNILLLSEQSRVDWVTYGWGQVGAWGVWMWLRWMQWEPPSWVTLVLVIRAWERVFRWIPRESWLDFVLSGLDTWLWLWSMGVGAWATLGWWALQQVWIVMVVKRVKVKREWAAVLLTWLWLQRKPCTNCFAPS